MYKMGYFPFAFVLMVCLLCFQENTAKPHNTIEQEVDLWPRGCKGNYCTERPLNYPADKLMKLFKDSKIDLPMHGNETEHRDGWRDICGHDQYFVEKVYMIRDENDEIRYALYIPGVFELAVEVRPCNGNTNLEEFPNVECETTYTQIPYIVLSHDQTALEAVRIKAGLPTSCAPIFKNDF